MQHPPCHSEIQQILPLLKPPHTTFWSHFLACEWHRLWEHLNAPCMERSPICVCKRERKIVFVKRWGARPKANKSEEKSLSSRCHQTSAPHAEDAHSTLRAFTYVHRFLSGTRELAPACVLAINDKVYREVKKTLISQWPPCANVLVCYIGMKSLWHWCSGLSFAHAHTLPHFCITVTCMYTSHNRGYVKQGETSLSHPNCLAVTPRWSLVLLWTFTITAGTHPVGVCHQLRGGK